MAILPFYAFRSVEWAQTSRRLDAREQEAFEKELHQKQLGFARADSRSGSGGALLLLPRIRSVEHDGVDMRVQIQR